MEPQCWPLEMEPSMALGPGKYDDLCTFVRERAGIGDQGGVIVIVVGGSKGNGFSCQGDLDATLALLDMLESVAEQMRRPVVKG
jgi:hypothetical protein